VIFIDSNIPMYLVGADHPNKHRARTLVETVVSRGDALVTDVEVLQEVLHRYAALRRTDAIQPAFDVTLSLVDEVLPVRLTHVQQAKDILLGDYSLSARDTLHLAVMADADITRIMSFDAGFDSYPGIERLS
jgi:predicted nucleic acid-binding protein